MTTYPRHHLSGYGAAVQSALRLASLVLCLPSLAVRASADDQTPIVFEAEGAAAVQGVFELFRSNACSQACGVTTREGRGADYDAHQSRRFREKQPGSEFDLEQGRADYHINATRAGRYILWARVYWLWECSNSFWLCHPSGARQMVTDGLNRRWHWVKARAPLVIPEGRFLLTIRNREDGICIDQFCLTTDRAFRPKGIMQPTVKPAGENGPAVFVHASVVTPVLLPGRPTTGTLWLRNDTGDAKTVTVVADGRDPVRICFPDGAQHVVSAGGKVTGVPFTVELLRHVPFATTRAGLTAVWGEGLGSNETSVVCTHMPLWHVSAPQPDEPWGWGRRSASPVGFPTTEMLNGLKWTRVVDPAHFTPAGRIDFLKLFPRSRHCVVWARTSFEWAAEETVPFELRSDDHGTLWVNGSLCKAHHLSAPADRYHANVALPFRTGTNGIVLRVTQDQGAWEAGIARATKKNE